MPIQSRRTNSGAALSRIFSLRECRGNTAIEIAVILPVLLLMVLGIIEFGRLLWTQSTLQNAVEAAARYATVYTDSNPTASSAQIQTAAQNQASTYTYGLSVPASDFAVTAYNTTTNTPSCGNQVTVTYPFSFVVKGLFPFSITLTATGCHQG